jgi:MipA family protein
MWNLRLVAVCLALTASPAFAQSADGAQADAPEGNWSGFISAGPGITPEYEGAKTYQVIPFISADLKYRSVTLEVRGTTARLDVLSALSGFGDGALYGGPAVTFKLPRDNKVGDVGNPVRQLTKIPFQVEAGGFIGVKLGGNEAGRGQFRIEATALGGSKGFEAIGKVSYALVRSRKVFVDVDNSITYANAKYMRTYFGVTPAEATASGLAAFTPGAGIKDVSSGLTIGYQFNKRWGIVANGNYSYLVGDAGKSPIVQGRLTGMKGEGSRSQFTGGVGILFRF